MQQMQMDWNLGRNALGKAERFWPWLTQKHENKPDGYGSIPINTIFRGMNIHQSQLFWCSPGVQGFDPSPDQPRNNSLRALWGPYDADSNALWDVKLCISYLCIRDCRRRWGKEIDIENTEAQLRMNPHAQWPPRYLDKSCHVLPGWSCIKLEVGGLFISSLRIWLHGWDYLCMHTGHLYTFAHFLQWT